MNVNWKNSVCIALGILAIVSIIFDYVTMRIQFASGEIGLIDSLLELAILIILLSFVIETLLSCIKKLKEGEDDESQSI